jgi:hypothetical protein
MKNKAEIISLLSLFALAVISFVIFPLSLKASQLKETQIFISSELTVPVIEANHLRKVSPGFDIKTPGVILPNLSPAIYMLLVEDAIMPTVSVTNLNDNAVVQTGIINGTASDNEEVIRVEIKLDSGGYTPAVGTTSWQYKLPTGEITWRDDSRHIVSVRALDRAGNYSDTITVTVRKGTNKDINGDGFGDLVVGASGEASLGNVFIYYGGASGISTIAGTTITGELSSNSFGDSLAVGDVNGDGYADIAIGDYYYDSSHGRVWIFHGGPVGISDVDLSSGDQADTTLDGEGGSSTNFGSYMGFGDVNGDGYADLAVGAPGWYGKIHVFHGGSSGIPNTDLASGQVSDTTITSAGGGELGEAVKIGDINADGYADLAVGAKGYNNRKGRVYIFYGGSSGISDTNLREGALADTTLTGASGNYGFGYRLAYGDVNGDGYVDLTVSAANNWEQGHVYIFHGSASGIPDTDLSAGGAADTVISGIGARNNFGYAITLEDITADGYDDMAVGARMYNLNQGRIYGFYSNGSKIPDKDLNQASADLVLTGETGSGLFGGSAVMIDCNGDASKDLAVGAPMWSSSSGRVYLFHNSGSGIPDTDLSAGDSADTTLTGESFSYFGETLADE